MPLECRGHWHSAERCHPSAFTPSTAGSSNIHQRKITHAACISSGYHLTDKRNENQFSFPSFPSERPTHLNSACSQWRENGKRTARDLPGGREGARGGPRCRACSLRHMHYTQSHLWLIFKTERQGCCRKTRRTPYMERSQPGEACRAG